MARIAVDPPIHWHPNYASLHKHYGRIAALSILAARASAFSGASVSDGFFVDPYRVGTLSGGRSTDVVD
jgi:hypothetical protein